MSSNYFNNSSNSDSNRTSTRQFDGNRKFYQRFILNIEQDLSLKKIMYILNTHEIDKMLEDPPEVEPIDPETYEALSRAQRASLTYEQTRLHHNYDRLILQKD